MAAGTTGSWLQYPGNSPTTTTGQITPPTPSPQQQSYNVYNTAVKQQAGDYDSIMKQYQDAARRAQTTNPALNFNPISPATTNYSPSQDYTNSAANLADLSATGGYTPQGIADLRARGISPIRSIYAGANRDIDRNRILQGGFSPNYAAAKAKMARELSESIGGAVQNVNAGIAQNVASNRLSASPAYASAAGAENALRTGVGERNSDVINSTNQFNASMPLQYGAYNLNRNNTGLDAIRGQASLYGTTPALSALFGNQALSAAQLQNMIDQQGRSNTLNATQAVLR